MCDNSRPKEEAINKEQYHSKETDRKQSVNKKSKKKKQIIIENRVAGGIISPSRPYTGVLTRKARHTTHRMMIRQQRHS